MEAPSTSNAEAVAEAQQEEGAAEAACQGEDMENEAVCVEEEAADSPLPAPNQQQAADPPLPTPNLLHPWEVQFLGTPPIVFLDEEEIIHLKNKRILELVLLEESIKAHQESIKAQQAMYEYYTWKLKHEKYD